MEDTGDGGYRWWRIQGCFQIFRKHSLDGRIEWKSTGTVLTHTPTQKVAVTKVACHPPLKNERRRSSSGPAGGGSSPGRFLSSSRRRRSYNNRLGPPFSSFCCFQSVVLVISCLSSAKTRFICSVTWARARSTSPRLWWQPTGARTKVRREQAALLAAASC